MIEKRILMKFLTLCMNSKDNEQEHIGKRRQLSSTDLDMFCSPYFLMIKTRASKHARSEVRSGVSK